jgi:conjugative relaxase-like TrwC/TraI family protein
MSVRRMSLGAGYRYLMASVARGDLGRGASDLTRYYAESGTPPGVFLGTGLSGLNEGNGITAGSAVSEVQLFRLLGMLQDPVTGRQLGRMPADNAVARFDLTFSVPKSVSVVWALADSGTRRLIEAAHQQALREVIGYGEAQVFASRTGTGGVVSEHVRGVVAVAFDHWDSRAGDPQLHTHVVVLNRAQSADGRWRTVDSKALFKAAVGMSELYNGLLADRLTAALGWAWIPVARAHSNHVKWEVDGVPETLTRAFSQRSQAIAVSKDALIRQFTAAHQRPPSAAEVIKLRQQATLDTRDAKEHRSLAELTASWTSRAPQIVDRPQDLTGSLAGRNQLPLLARGDLDPGMLDQLSRLTLTEVADKRATFARGNVLAEVHRQLQGIRFADAADRITVADTTTSLALQHALVIGTPRLEPASRDRILYTTKEILDAETRLLQAGRDSTAPTATTPVPVANDTPLSAEQAAAVEDIATSARAVDVLIGAAGTGKTTTMTGLRATWEATHGPGSVIGLAPSAAAAQVLATELGIPADNTAKWLTEHARHPERHARIEHYQQLKTQHRHPIQRRQFADGVVVGGDHDRVQAVVGVGFPGVVELVESLVLVLGVGDTTPTPTRGAVAAAQDKLGQLIEARVVEQHVQFCLSSTADPSPSGRRTRRPAGAARSADRSLLAWPTAHRQGPSDLVRDLLIVHLGQPAQQHRNSIPITKPRATQVSQRPSREPCRSQFGQGRFLAWPWRRRTHPLVSGSTIQTATNSHPSRRATIIRLAGRQRESHRSRG